MNWDDALKCWRATAVVFENHPSGCLESHKKFTEKIVKSLISEGHIAEKEEIRDADDSTSWMNLPVPKCSRELPPPIVGLRTFPHAIQCTAELDCGYISTVMVIRVARG